MNKRILSGMIGVAVVLILVACQAQAATQTGGLANGSGSGAAAGSGNGGAGSGGGNFQANPDFQTRVASNPALQTRIASGGFSAGGTGFARRTPTPTLMPTIADNPTPTPTVVTAGDMASQTVQAYFTALQGGNFAAASKLVSAFSLTTAQTTAADVANQLAQQQQQGAAWSNLQVKDSQQFSDNTVLVHVQYQMASKDPKTGQITQAQKDELWPVRLEVGKWLYNWNNVIDFESLNIPYQQTAGLTIAPLKITRYSDHLTLTVLAQNATNDAIVIGTANQTLATFHFGSQAVDAVNTRYILDSQRSYSNIDITVNGLYKTFPDAVDIIQYKNAQVKPWFTFNLNG